MPDSTVTTTFFADEKSAVAAITRLEKKYSDLEGAVKHMHGEHKKGHSEALHQLEEWGTGLAGMVLGFGSIEGAIEKVFEVTKEWRQETDKAALAIDNANRKFAIRTGAGEETTERIRESGGAAGLSHRDSEELFAQLDRQGFDQDSMAKGFKEIAATFAANRAATGVSAEGFAKAIEHAMDRNTPKDAGAIVGGGRGLFDITRGTQISPDDIAGFGDTFKNLKGGKGEERRIAALAKLNITTDQVDMLGEDLPQILELIKSRLDQKPIEDRMGIMKEITKDGPGATRLLAALEKMGDNDKGFEQAQRLATTGLGVGLGKAGDIKEELAAKEGGDFALQADAADILSRKKGAAGWMSGIRRGTAESLRGLGLSDENAIGMSFGTAGEAFPSDRSKELFMEGVKELTQALKDGKDAQEVANEIAERMLAEKNGKLRPQRQAEE